MVAARKGFITANDFCGNSPLPDLEKAGILHPDSLNLRTRAIEAADSNEDEFRVGDLLKEESVSEFVQKYLKSMDFPSHVTQPHCKGTPGSDSLNPVAIALSVAVMEWAEEYGVEYGDSFRVEIRLPTNAIVRVVNENGVCGHCPLPQNWRECLSRFHAGQIPEMILET